MKTESWQGQRIQQVAKYVASAGFRMDGFMKVAKTTAKTWTGMDRYGGFVDLRRVRGDGPGCFFRDSAAFLHLGK